MTTDDKEGKVVGTIRLYNIDENECEHGSCIVDENCAGMPYALEIMIFSVEFAFKKLGVNVINGNVRKNNDSMNSIIARAGFKAISPMDIRDIEYIHNELKPEDSKIDRFKLLLSKYMAKRK
jgi:RimJ/RimL family protein N-acetyltransferase